MSARNVLVTILAKLHAFWLIRLLVWSAEERREYRLERALQSHPDLERIAAKIRELQLSASGEPGSFEDWNRSEEIDRQIKAYDFRLLQLKNEKIA